MGIPPTGRSGLVWFVIGLLLLVGAVYLLSRVRRGSDAKPQDESPAGAAGWDFPIEIRDALHRQVVLERRPKRIVSLSPSITEILFAIKAEDRLIAVTPFCEFPPEARALPKVGGESGWNVEFLRKLNPDLLLASIIVPPDTVQALESAGIKTAVFRHAGMQGTLQDIEVIGRITGSTQESKRLLEQIDLRRRTLQERVRQKVKQRGHPRTLLLYGLDGYFSAGKGTFAGEILEFAGGQNVAALVPGDWPQLSLEFIIREDPQVLILAEGYGNTARHRTQEDITQIKQDPKWHFLSAVRSERIYLMEDQLLSIPGPRMIEAAEKVFAMLFPAVSTP